MVNSPIRGSWKHDLMGTQWIKSEVAQKFVAENPTVAKWLGIFDSTATKGNYGRILYHFCKWAGKSPAELLELQRQAKIGGPDTEFKVLDDLVHKFLLQGIINDDSIRGRGRQIKISETGKANRQLFNAAIRSFYSHNRLPLPRDPNFKIKEKSRVNGTLEQVQVQDARAIIGATKDPYRTLFACAMFAGLGQGELILLNELWPEIRDQVKAGSDPVTLRFSHRKLNEKEYFTFIPKRLLEPFIDVPTEPFRTGRGTPVSGPDLETSWKFAKKRAGITKRFRIHDLRDLFRTLCWRVEIAGETANFLMGHSIANEHGYLRMIQEEGKVAEQWGKVRSYLETGVATELAGKLLAKSSEENQELRESLRQMQEQVKTLQGQFETILKTKFQ